MVRPRRIRKQAAQYHAEDVNENAEDNPPRKKQKSQKETNKNVPKPTLSKKLASKKSKEPLIPVVVDVNNKSSLINSDTSDSVCDGTVHCYNDKRVGLTVQPLDRFQRKLINSGLGKKTCELNVKGYRNTADKSKNLIHLFQNLSCGIKSRVQLRKAITCPIVSLTKDFELFRTASPFDRRVTALEWHPTKHTILGVGSKGGDIILWDSETVNNDKFVHGIGAAGSCQAMKFWPWNLDKVVSASINGTVTLHDFELQDGQILADTLNSYDHWYCSLDVCPSRYLVVAGRNNGTLHMMSTEGRKVFECRLHKNKITHVEFSPREDWLLCTASTDQRVIMWDVRYMKDRQTCLQILQHQKPVNSAYFSHTDGCRLLTTDQNRELRVYKGPEWHLETTIEHPHRFFQHITPFKATWHPLQDLIVCGRYPDSTFPGSSVKELRTIDVFDAASGEMVSQLFSPAAEGLCPLNKFNHQGDALASGMGFHVLLWNRKQNIQMKQSILTNLLKSALGISEPHPETQSGNNQRSGSNPGSAGQRSDKRSKKRGDPDTDDLKKKKSKTSDRLKAKTKTETQTKRVKKDKS